MINYWLGSMNLADTLSQRPDLNNSQDTVSMLLPTLQWKLANITRHVRDNNLWLKTAVGQIVEDVTHYWGDMILQSDLSGKRICTLGVLGWDMKIRIAFGVYNYRIISWGTSGVQDQLADHKKVGSQSGASNSLAVTGQGGLEHLVSWFLVSQSAETETAYTESALALVDLVRLSKKEHSHEELP